MMNSVFSVDDFSDSYWPSPSSSPGPAPVHAFPMNRSQSEWALEKFLEEVTVSPGETSVGHNIISSVIGGPEVSRPSVPRADDDVVEIKRPHPDQAVPRPLDPFPSAPVYTDEHSYLKSRLDQACAAAVALRASNVKPEDKSSLAENQTQAAKPSQLGSEATAVLPAMQRKSGVQVRQTTSGSSRDDSDDDDLDGDTETTDCLDPLDDRRARRMQSNRESARRSRRRKQAHLSELETQAGQLKVEHSTLLKGLTDMNHKYDEAAVNNRILKADIETLRAKVKMAEETVKRVTGLNPMVLGRSNVPNVGMQYVSTPMDASTIAVAPMQPNPNQFIHQTVPSIASAAPNQQRLDTGFPSNTQVPVVGNPSNDNRESVSPSGAMPGWDSGIPRVGAKN
ncbi:hypothetical protein LWI28_007209 [Acer negundo]|uniref:BZIP domain-containing protein n=1 Tax=Acer negundo TaxID=4023 RepID=A0AAD5NTX9_ACENE|nr:hypothetical protein LWI28_007209 [Acer negundo]KAK4847636.1 hypothetical protein QYF36_004193 [Acer negundo]